MMRTLAVACLVAACAGRTTLRDPHEAELAISVHNETGAGVCAVYIFLAGHPERGDNKLPPQTRIVTGDSAKFYVPKRDPAETFQVEAGGCPDDKQQVSGYAPSVFMNGPAVVVFFDEGAPSSKEAAGALAHANENTTLVPAKYSRRTAR